MSNLFKSKFLMGFMVVALAFSFSFLGNTSKVNAADGTITKTLRYKMKDVQVKYLQQTLNETGYAVDGTGAGSVGKETTYFGNATLASVKAFQKANGLTADGIFGAKSRAALMATPGTGTTTTTTTTTGTTTGCPAGAMYNSITGVPCSSSTTTTTTTTTQTGPISAMLSTDNPAAGTIVAGQATADLLHITFTGNGTVNSVTLQRSGVSDQNTLSNVYLYDGVTRVTDGYSFNTTGMIMMNNLNIVVNGSKTIAVKADVSSSTNSYDIKAALVGFTSGTTANTVSIMGNDMYIAAGGSLATIAKDSTGVATGATGGNTVANASVNAGTTSYTVWRQVMQVNTRNVQLKAANFRITGSAPSDALANVNLFVDGVKVGSNATMTMANGSNYLTFDMTVAPVTLTTGSHTFEVRGDIVKGSSFSFTVSLQQASDLMVTDPQIGVNLAVCGTLACTGSFSASTAGTISIGAGSATVVIDPTFNTMTNVTGGSSNIAIGKFKIHGYGEDVKVTSLPVSVALSAGTTPAGIQNVTLYFNGSQVGSQISLTSGSVFGASNCTTGGSGFTCYSNTFSLGSQMIIPAATDSILEVRADLRNSSGTNYTTGTISANLGTGTAEGFNSKAAITTNSQTGNTLTIQTGLLAVAKNTGYSNQTVSPNTSGVKLGSYVVQNQSSSESVRVTSLVVNLYDSTATTPLDNTTTTPKLNNFSGLRTSETSGSGSTPVQPQASNTFSVDFTLAPGATKIIDVFADTSSTTGGAQVITKLAVNALGSSSNTSISIAAQQGQTVTLNSGTLGAPVLLSASSTAAQFVPAGDPTNTGTGAADATRADYTFVSTNGAATISELKFTVGGNATNPIMSVKVGSATAPVVSGVAWLQGLNLAVPNGGSGLTVTAYATYAPVGTNAVVPNTTASISLSYVKYQSGTSVSTVSFLTAGGKTYNDVDGSGTVTAGDIRTVAQDKVVATAGAVTGTITANATTFVTSKFSSALTEPATITLNKSAGDVWTVSAGTGWTTAVVTGGAAAVFPTSVTSATGEVITFTGGTTTTGAGTAVVTLTRSAGFYTAGSTVASGDSDLGLAASAGVLAPTMTMVGSRPTVSVNTTTSSGLQLSSVENKVGELTIAADAKGDIKLDQITFNLGISNFAATPVFSAPRIADGTTTIAGSSCTPTTQTTLTPAAIVCTFGTFSSPTSNFDGYTISAGTSKTLSLFLNVNGSATASTVASISSSVLNTGFYWDDTSTNGVTGTGLTGASLYNFPTGSYSIHQ